ncbi:hypothetical protein SCALM49S_01411 [Streptomyces californicus]
MPWSGGTSADLGPVGGQRLRYRLEEGRAAEEQSPLPPEVRPSAVSPAKRAPPLSPGSAQTVVSIRPLTMSPLP